MATLYVGDVHGCAEELRSIIELAQPDEVLLTGDLFSRGPDPDGVWELIRQYDCRAVMGNHEGWLLKSLAAGEVKASSARLLERQPELLAFVESMPQQIRRGRVVLVHAGVHPIEGPEQTPAEMGQQMRRFPMGSDGPFWYDAGWSGPELIVFGHDAMRGVVERFGAEGQRIALGLDSGCVYGGALTGWLAEEDRLLTVPARKRYYPV